MALRILGVLLAAALLSGCDGGERASAPSQLLDGSPALPAPVELEGVDAPTVLTTARVADAVAEGGLSRSCLAAEWELRRAAESVERVGSSSQTVTFREASGQAVFGCDDTACEREGDREWCGASFGLLREGRLLDPRLDLLCASPAGEPMAFAWVEPSPGATYVAVRQPGFVEVYEPAAGLPVRIATGAGVDLERSRARFEVSEHDASGRLIRQYELEAFVAG
ncbi:MAG TPA: hypothetical protein VK926_05190 [Gaiellaceae bacterium]|nr:hypothetical protein [Gaiellaceae bacterium]